MKSNGSTSGPHEIRCVKRNFLLETLESELPEGTIRYSSKIAAIDEEGDVKLLHMADGSIIKAKVQNRYVNHVMQCAFCDFRISFACALN